MIETLQQKLLPPPKKYGTDSIKRFYKDLDINSTKFRLNPTTEDIVLKLLKNIAISKIVGISNFGKIFKGSCSHFRETSHQNMISVTYVNGSLITN